MSEWKEYRLGDLIKINESTIKKGSSLKQILYFDTSTVTEGIFDKPELVKLEDAPSRAKRIVKNNDVVISTVRPNLKHYGYIRNPEKNWIFSTGFAVITAKEIDSKFLYYLISNDFITQFLILIAESQTSTYPSFNPVTIENIKVKIPENKETQQKIANILGTYDELIEVNNERIKILEETAQSLYKEWFVRFRFPNYQNTEFIKGVPKGWEVVKLKNLVSTQYGFTESASSEKIGPKFLRITDIVDKQIDWSSVPYCKVPEKDLNKYLLKCGDIVVARTGATVGFAKRIHKNPPEAVFASYLVRLKPLNDLLSIYLGLSIDSQNYRNYIETVASGSAQPGTNANVMSEFYLFKPNIELLEKLNYSIDPILEQIEILQQQNTELRQIRDRLLPRLISGKIVVVV